MHLGYAIKFVSDMDASVAFYRDTLGLSLLFHRRSGASSTPEKRNSRCTLRQMKIRPAASNSA